MVRHMMLNALIVFVVYLALLLVIGHPFVNQLTHVDSDIVEIDETATEYTPLDQSQVTNELKEPFFKGPIIVGITSIVNFEADDQEVDLLWQQLLANTALINNVDWSKGEIKVYAYYRDFTADMNQARLTIGFAEEDLKFASNMTSKTLPRATMNSFLLILIPVSLVMLLGLKHIDIKT